MSKLNRSTRPHHQPEPSVVLPPSIKNFPRFLVAATLSIVSLGWTGASAQTNKPHEVIAPIAQQAVELERSQFRALLLSNPNYFGNSKGSTFKPIKLIAKNTTYEELDCIGFNPQFDRLEAVVLLKKQNGYGGGICSAGSQEYLRFYLSFDDGATWTDEGLTNFTAFDLPGVKPLEIAATLDINPQKRICRFPNLPKVRAILSWNTPPPPNQPDWPPVWGNVMDANIQIGTVPWILIDEFFEAVKFKLAPEFKELLNPKQALNLKEPVGLSASERHSLYSKAQDVQPNRYLYPDVQKFISQPQFAETVNSSKSATGAFPLLPGVDWSAVIGDFLKNESSTQFEQLGCVGLDPQLDTLAAVVTVKLPNGYSGGLCSAGSQEYVAFWVDWGSGNWEYVGTSSVTVHDIIKLPNGGLQYAVFQPIDVLSHQRPCVKGAVTAKIRAVLSWEAPPPPWDPDFQPHWGNRHDTLIQIYPGPETDPGGNPRPYLESIGSAPVCEINQNTGMTNGEQPFGASINVTGFIINAPDISSPNPLKYRIYVRERPPFPNPPGVWQPLANTFNINFIQQIGNGLPTGGSMSQAIDGDGFYTYREDWNPSGSGWRLVQDRMLAIWSTGLPMAGLWEIKVEAKDPVSGVIFTAGTITCSADGTTRTNANLLLDEVPPTATLAITGFSRGGGPVQPGADCGDFRKGDVIQGTYSVSDAHFRRLEIQVKPVGPAGGAMVNPSTRIYPIVSTVGESGTWTLDTAPMDACGYIVELVAWDRTIVSQNASGWPTEASVGLCLKGAP